MASLAHASPTPKSTRQTSFSASSWRYRVVVRSAMLVYFSWNVSSDCRREAIVIGVMLLTPAPDLDWNRWQSSRNEKRSKKQEKSKRWQTRYPSDSANSSKKRKRRRNRTRKKQARSEDHQTTHHHHRRNRITVTNLTSQYLAKSFSTTQHAPTRSVRKLWPNSVGGGRIQDQQKIFVGPRTTSISLPMSLTMINGVNVWPAAEWCTSVLSCKQSSSMRRHSSRVSSIKKIRNWHISSFRWSRKSPNRQR